MNWYERDTLDDSVGLDLTGDNAVRHWSQLPPAPIYPRLFERPADAAAAATTLSLDENDLLELRDRTPSATRGREPDATVPELRSSRRSAGRRSSRPCGTLRDEAAAPRDEAAELNTTLKLDEDDLLEVREEELRWSDEVVELPINPGMRAVATIGKLALPLVLVASLTWVLAPADRTPEVTTPAPAAGRVIAFGALERLPAPEAPTVQPAAVPDLPAAIETRSDVFAPPVVGDATSIAKTDSAPPRQRPQVRRRRPKRSPRVIGPTARQLRRYKRALSSARRALRRQHWAKARQRAAAALVILPRDRRARAIKRLAERKLRGGRRYL